MIPRDVATRLFDVANTIEEVHMHSVWFGEFMGTLVLILLGNGVNAGVSLRNHGNASLTLGLAVVFFLVSTYFVHRSFYGMRIESK